MIDLTAEFGTHVAHRLRMEQVVWLTTISPGGAPQPNPVWFLWEDDSFLIYTLPDSVKIRNLKQNNHVSLHFNCDEWGGDVVIFTGEAIIDQAAPPANQHPAYLEKYRGGIADIEMTPESFATAYSVPVRVKPARMRGF
ncbi:MAG: TIGR03667 family PPOX class F420-dependent oxidoreductase [Chloroflexota bacterium]|nr:MAG: TIGR03667 family PPOX class F420-dependent oxidoreductase [Chloroflexota bacterium]